MKGLRNRTVFHKLVIGVLWGAEVEVGVTGMRWGPDNGGLGMSYFYIFNIGKTWEVFSL